MTPKDIIKRILDGLGAIAELLGQYRKTLMANGFSKKESLTMCLDFQRSLFSGLMEKNK